MQLIGTPLSARLVFFVRVFFALVGAGILGVRSAPAEELTQIGQIRRLSPEEADQRRPVRLRGTVTWISTYVVTRSIFIQDETGGTYFRPGDLPLPAIGDEVEVVGRTVFGIYVPGVIASDYRVLRSGALPAAVPATFDDLLAGRFHYQRVAVEGIVRSFSRFNDQARLMRLNVGTRILEVHIYAHFDDEAALVDRRVRVEALAVGSVNKINRRQLLRPFLRVQSKAEVTPLDPPRSLAATPHFSGDKLLGFADLEASGHRVRVSGVVTALFPDKSVFLRDGAATFGARLTATPALAVGDRVEIGGFPHAEHYNVVLEDAEVLRREPGTPPAPTSVSLSALLRGLHASDLVAVRGTVMHVAQTSNGWQVLLRDNAATIELEVAAPAPPLTPGSEISVVGISSIERSSHRGMEEQPNFVRLRARSGPDVTILRQPPWWTPQRLAALLAALALVVAVAIIWILLLRRQVRRQTAALEANIKLEAVRQERQRIAREFHDTLAQDLTGLRLRLDAIGAHALEHSVTPLLTASRSLVTRIQIETKNLVSDLRDPDQPVRDLRQVLVDLAEQCTSDRMRVRAEVAALPPSFSAATTHHLKMIAQEVVTNALRHANASEIVLRLEQRDERWLLTVADDGAGFDVAACAHGTGGHFGCMGIRERCLKIDAGVNWISAPGEGTLVEVVLPRSSPPSSSPSSSSAPHLSPCHPATPFLS